ncbi:inversin-B-like isoform X3 [Cherax quadricarinatus]|uniref:inversin-B-like isoform X3 n=1 Tax=Cherax quadricarinatus TaxID=27406 RepID=UPI00387E400D
MPEQEDAEARRNLLGSMNPGDIVLSMEEPETALQVHDTGGTEKCGSQQTKVVKKSTEAHHAAEVGDVDSLQKLVKEHPENLSIQDNYGNTPLHLAAKGGYLECCEIILEISTKEVNLKNKAGNSPLLLSIETGKKSTKITELLIHNGSKLNMTYKGKWTALHIASEKGNVETLKLLLKHDKKCLRAKDSEGLTSLHVAAKNGHKRTCNELVEAGANIEERDSHGSTPLHWAAKMGFTECCRKLLEHNASINSENSMGNTPLHLLCASGKEKPDCARLLIEYGADVNAQNKNGETPFHLSFRSPIEMTKSLLEENVNLQLTDCNGKTALHYAAERSPSNYVKLVMTMKNSKEIINNINKQGKTALQVAISKKAAESSKFLIKVGADCSITCGKTGTALHIAAQNGLNEICDYLINKGVKVDTKNSEGLTPLHMAAKAGHEDCCVVLCKRSNSPDVPDNNGMTALHHAAKGKHVSCCHVITGRYPNSINSEDNSGKTPLHIAVEAKSLECCKVMVTPKTDLWATSLTDSPIKMASEADSHDIFKFLLDKVEVKRSHSKKDINFQELFEKSLENKDRQMMEIIIDSCFCEEAFKPAEGILEKKLKNKNLILLVKDYPDLVRRVLDKCIQTPNNSKDTQQKPPDNSEDTQQKPSDNSEDTQQKPSDNSEDTQQQSSTRYLVHYLDEAYPLPGKKHESHTHKNESDTHKNESVTYKNISDTHKNESATRLNTGNQNSLLREPFETESGKLVAGMEVAKVDQDWRNDHLLECIIRYKHYDLLRHPLVTCWLRYKWKQYIKWHQVFCLVMACFLAILLTVFTVISWDWMYMQKTYNITQSLVCSTGDEKPFAPQLKHLLKQENKVPHDLGIVILLALSIGILQDLYKILRNWQWLVGVVAVVTSWLNVLLMTSAFLMTNVFLMTRSVSLRTRILRFCSSSFFQVIHLLRTLFWITFPLVVIGTLIYIINTIGIKGEIAYNHVWDSVIQVISQPWVGTAIYVALTIVIWFEMFDKKIKKQKKKYMDSQSTFIVEIILNIDVLYPYLRKKFYVFWILKHAKKNLRLPLQRNKDEEELSETESDSEVLYNIKGKFEKLQQDIEKRNLQDEEDNIKGEIKTIQEDIKELKILLQDIKKNTDKKN